MTAIIYKWLAGLLVAVFVVSAIWWYGNRAGHKSRDLACRAEIADINARLIESERQATALKEKGRILADRLAAQASDAQAALDAARRNADDRITAMASASRRALDSALVRLLNDLTPVRTAGDHQAVAAPAGTAAPVPAAAADPARPAAGYASERAVVRAIADCRVGYESCRVRHGALAEWAESVTR